MEDIKEYLHEFRNKEDFQEIYHDVVEQYPESVYVEAVEHIGESETGNTITLTLPFSCTTILIDQDYSNIGKLSLYSNGNYTFTYFDGGGSFSLPILEKIHIIAINSEDITNVAFGEMSYPLSYTLNGVDYTLYDDTNGTGIPVYKNNNNEYMFNVNGLFYDLSDYYDATNKTFDFSSALRHIVENYEYSSNIISIGESKYYEPWVSLTTFENENVVNEIVDEGGYHWVFDKFDGHSNGRPLYKWRQKTNYNNVAYSNYRVPTKLFTTREAENTDF